MQKAESEIMSSWLNKRVILETNLNDELRIGDIGICTVDIDDVFAVYFQVSRYGYFSQEIKSKFRLLSD